MADIYRPNRDILDRALGIYRDSMREFLIRNLKRVKNGRALEETVKSALPDGRRLTLEDHLRQGKDIKSSIDIGDFQRLVTAYWDPVFREVFNNDRSVQTFCRLLTSSRNQAVHTDTQDIGAERSEGLPLPYRRNAGPQ